MRRGAGSFLDVVAALLSIGAGIYLLIHQAPAGSESWLSVIAHGLGVYMVAKGIWMARSLHLQSALVDEARREDL